MAPILAHVCDIKLEIIEVGDKHPVLAAGWYYTITVKGWGNKGPHHECGPHDSRDECQACAEHNMEPFIAHVADWIYDHGPKEKMN